jgi:hypothetical protein
MLRLLVLLTFLQAGDDAARFHGQSYELPPRWQVQDQGELRALVAPRARDGQLLVVMLTAPRPAAGDPAAQLEAFGREVEGKARRLQAGKAAVHRAGAFTVVTQLVRIDQPGVGEQQRIYELVTDGKSSALVMAISSGEETLAANRDPLARLLASVRPGPAPMGNGGASPAEEAAVTPAAAGIPTGPCKGAVDDKDFAPTGHGVAIPPAALRGDRPVGLWWNVNRTSSSFVGFGSIYATVFLEDGTVVRFFRPGGPRLVDLACMHALGDDKGYVGRYTVSGGVLTTDFGEFRPAKPIRPHRDGEGPYFVWNEGEYHPAVPLTPKYLAGTWKMGAMGTITFRPDGTVATTANVIGASWTHQSSNDPVSGTWTLDGYLLALQFPRDGHRVYYGFQGLGGQLVLGQGLLTRP